LAALANRGDKEKRTSEGKRRLRKMGGNTLLGKISQKKKKQKKKKKKKEKKQSA